MKIAICNYQFVATNNKKTIIIYNMVLSSLVGDTVEQIIADPTGRNMACLRRHFKRENKTKSNLNEFKLKLTKVTIVKFYGSCQNIYT